MVDLVLSPPILEELLRVLVVKFQHTTAEAEEVMSFLHETATIVNVPGKLRVVKDDPDDDKFLETAEVGGAQYIVSGDRHLLEVGTYAGIAVIGARTFLDLLSSRSE